MSAVARNPPEGPKTVVEEMPRIGHDLLMPPLDASRIAALLNLQRVAGKPWDSSKRSNFHKGALVPGLCAGPEYIFVTRMLPRVTCPHRLDHMFC